MDTSVSLLGYRHPSLQHEDSASTIAQASNLGSELAASDKPREAGYVSGDMFCTSRSVSRNLKALVEAEALQTILEYRSAPDALRKTVGLDFFRRYCSLGSPCFLILPRVTITSLEALIAKGDFPRTMFDPVADLVQQRWRDSQFWDFFKSAFSSVQYSYLGSSATPNAVLPLLAEELFRRSVAEFDSDSGWELAHEPRRHTRVFFKVCQHRRCLFVRSVSIVQLPPAKVYEGALSLELPIRRRLDQLLEDVTQISAQQNQNLQRLRYTSLGLLEESSSAPCFRYFTTLRIRSELLSSTSTTPSSLPLGYIERDIDDGDLTPPAPPTPDIDPSRVIRGKVAMNCVLVFAGESEQQSRVVSVLRLQPCGDYDQDTLHEALLGNVPYWNRLAEAAHKPALERRNAAALPSDKKDRPIAKPTVPPHPQQSPKSTPPPTAAPPIAPIPSTGSGTALHLKQRQQFGPLPQPLTPPQPPNSSPKRSQPLSTALNSSPDLVHHAPPLPLNSSATSSSSSSSDDNVLSSSGTAVAQRSGLSSSTENKDSPRKTESLRKGISKITGWLRNSTVSTSLVSGMSSSFVSAAPKEVKIGAPKGFTHRTHVSVDLIWSAQDEASVFDLRYPIGRGAAAVVWAAVQRGTEFNAAIKVVPVDEAVSDEVKESLVKEVNILRALKHPNIVSYFGTMFRARELWIIMDLCELGTIYEVLLTRPSKRLTETQTACVVASCVAGLAYIHGRGIIHRDLKSKNILLSPDGHAKIADFGVARQLGPVIATEKRSFIGTPLYMAPEIILENPYNAKADLWSLGIMSIELAEGIAPNSGLSPVIVLKRIVMSPSPKLRDDLGFSNDFHDFVNSCLQKDITLRPGSEELLTHPFFLQGQSHEKATLTALAKEVKAIKDAAPPPHTRTRELSLQFQK